MKVVYEDAKDSIRRAIREAADTGKRIKHIEIDQNELNQLGLIYSREYLRDSGAVETISPSHVKVNCGTDMGTLDGVALIAAEHLTVKVSV